MTDKPLASWNDTPTRDAILRFVTSVSVPPAERVAVFDNDGTLWCEKPMPVELVFILHRLAAMAEQDASLRERDPWRAAYHRNYEWLGEVITKHYQGDDSDVKVLMTGILQAFRGVPVEEYEAAAAAFLHDAQHPTLGRPLHDCGYQPMSSCSVTSRRTGSPATSPPAATATSCDRSPRTSTAFRRSA